MLRLPSLLLALLCLLAPTVSAAAQLEKRDSVPTRYGVALLAGSAYDPERIGLVIAQGQVLLDYDRIAWHRAPEPLRLKLEANLGLTTDGRQRLLFSLDMLALYYLENYRAGRWTPYVEAGIGLIYTDFRVAGQGLRFNFNPQAGAGYEYALGNGGALTTALRLHHLSNGDLYDENRGINSALLLFGYLF